MKPRSPLLFVPYLAIALCLGAAVNELPPPNQHKLGGYETWLGTSRFQPQSSDFLIKHLLEMLENLNKLK